MSNTGGDLDNSVVALEEPSQYMAQGYAFSYVNTTIVSNTAETRLINIVNSGSRTMYIAKLLLGATSTGSNWIDYIIYNNPTVTANGTLQTVAKLNPSSSLTSAISLYTSPTVTANGTRIYYYTGGVGNSQAQPIFTSSNPYIMIPPSNSLLINGIAKANNTVAIMNIIWFEVP